MRENFIKMDNLKNSIMLFDQMNYLPDDIVVKMERASMANSLEVRSPFLHSDIVTLANSIPIKFKTNNKEGKIITKSIVSTLTYTSMFLTTISLVYIISS